MGKGSTGSKQTKRYSWIIGLLIFITALLLGCIIVKNIEKEKKTAAAYTAQSTVIVKAFELAPDGIITDIFPEQGNEQAFGMNMLTEHERSGDAKRAKETGKYTLGGPY